ncbi:MAG TPA: hypothetical protein VN937_05115 [Blastocatellia bacterium]|nr:hypothetical protein [Blastocatellia bacterium]
MHHRLFSSLLGGVIALQGAIFVAGSLQPLWPEAVMAATLNQYRVPLTSTLIVTEDFADTAACVREVAVSGTRLSIT